MKDTAVMNSVPAQEAGMLPQASDVEPGLSGLLALHGGWDSGPAERNGYEYRLLEAGGWELEQMHGVLEMLSADGWRLDAAYGPDGPVGDAGLHLWLRRPVRRPGNDGAGAEVASAPGSQRCDQIARNRINRRPSAVAAMQGGTA